MNAPTIFHEIQVASTVAATATARNLCKHARANGKHERMLHSIQPCAKFELTENEKASNRSSTKTEKCTTATRRICGREEENAKRASQMGIQATFTGGGCVCAHRCKWEPTSYAQPLLVRFHARMSLVWCVRFYASQDVATATECFGERKIRHSERQQMKTSHLSLDFYVEYCV